MKNFSKEQIKEFMKILDFSKIKVELMPVIEN